MNLRPQPFEEVTEGFVFRHGACEIRAGQIRKILPRSVESGLIAKRVPGVLQQNAPKRKDVRLSEYVHEFATSVARSACDPRRHTTHTYIGRPEMSRMSPQYTISWPAPAIAHMA